MGSNFTKLSCIILSLEINSGEDQVYVLATTNMPWELDIAALRR